MDTSILKQALEQAKADRSAKQAGIAEKLKAVEVDQASVTLLDEFIRNGQALLAQAGDLDLATQKVMDLGPTREQADPSRDPLWMGARDVLRELRRPLSIPELGDFMITRGWKVIPSKIGIETLRATVVQKKDVFVRVQQGHYGLVEWPEELRRVA